MVIGILLAVALVAVWALVTVLRTGSGGVEGVTEARNGLRMFADRSLELESVPAILAFAREAAQAIFGIQRVVAFLGDPDGAWHASIPGEEQLGEVPAAMRGFFGWAKHNNSICVEVDLGHARYGAMRGPLRQIMARYGVDVVMPLVERQQVLAVVGLRLGRKPTQVDRELIRLFRLQATTACANVRLHREAAHAFSLAQEVDLASAVQLALVPDDMGGGHNALSWAGDVRPAGEAGSDFWAVYPLDDGRLVMIIGDAVGVHLAGSMVSAVVKSCADAIFDAHPTNIDPVTLLGALNRALYRSSNPVHTSCFAVIFDTARRKVVYANAGHEIPYRLSFDGADGVRLGVLSGSGPLLGDSAKAQYKVHEARLGDEDAFVLFTDGLFKAENRAGEAFGARRLQKLLKKQTSKAPEAIRKSVLDAVAAHAGDVPISDDAALVVVTYGS